MTSDAHWLARRIAYQFKDEDLLQRALTHRSAAGKADYERLEFLGDSILNFLVADELYRRRPQDAEGDLSRLRAFLVRGATLAELAAELELGSRLKLGPGELKSGGFRRASILADALEAVLGAVYLDGGVTAARGVVRRLYARRLDNLPAAAELKDPKTRLQEWAQGRGSAPPRYEVTEATGREHQRQFTVRCELSTEGHSCEGSGPSRRAAEQDAARRLLAEIGDER